MNYTKYNIFPIKKDVSGKQKNVSMTDILTFFVF